MTDYKSEKQEVDVLKEPDYSRSYTARDYLDWTFEGLYELIHGVAHKMSPAPSANHQRISRKLSRVFFNYFQEGQKCEAFNSPIDVFLIKEGEDWKETKVILEPDLCIICDPAKIQKQGCIGSPDFVLEILSPATAKKDFTDKFSLYEEYGVAEYWIVDPFNKCVIRNILKQEKYEIQRAAFAEELISPQQFPELTIKVADVFEGIGHYE